MKNKCEDEVVENTSLVSVINKEDTPNEISILIDGEINETTSHDLIQELLSINWEDKKVINLYIFSQGGYLDHCFAIIDMLLDIKEKYNVTINSFGLGEVASAGFFIFICGDKRKLYPSCRVYVHTHITLYTDQTYYERIKSDKTDEKEVYDNYLQYTATQLNISTARTKNLLKKQKWLTKKEIADYNVEKD